MNFRRIFLVLIGGIGVIYLAAFAAANPDTPLANIVIYGVIVLFVVLWLNRKIGWIIKLLFRKKSDNQPNS